MGLYLIGLLGAAEFSWISLDSWLAILKVAVGLGGVILVHELGHFLVAKACGVKCEKFYIGFDFFDIKVGSVVLIPRALVKWRWGETEYGVGIIPLGGYVKMLGQDDNPSNAAREAERIRVARQSAAAGEATPAPVHHEIPHGDLPAEPTQEQLEQYTLDPRSYPAKSVPQRMAIISAGVIMNLIFAVLFAAVAYRLGVSYVPTIVGAVMPGSPAWKAGIEPGDHILQVGREGEPSERLRFDWDLLQSVGMAGADAELPLLIRRSDGREEWVAIRPSTELISEDFPAIGVVTANTNRLAPEDPVLKGSAARQASPPLAPGDTIIAVDGEPVDDGQELRVQLGRKADEAVTFTVRRIKKSDPEQEPEVQDLDITVPRNPMRHFGLVMQIGRVAEIKPGSPADEAGFRAGDVIRQVNGRLVGDPLTLPLRLRRLAGQTVEFQVVRRAAPGGPARRLTLTAVPQNESLSAIVYPNLAMAAEPLGLAYYVTNQVAFVQPDTPAARAGLKRGDRLTAAQFVPGEKAEAKRQFEKLGLREDDLKLGSKLSWPYVSDMIQKLPPAIHLRLTYERDGKVHRSVSLQAVNDEQFFVPERGIRLVRHENIYTARSWGEAFALGLRQTKEDALKVLIVLKKLVTGALPIYNLGGPGSIAYVATSEASQGTARLLIFLTFLSANLAVLNFLPIPVLDGGHMMFLIAEGIRGKPLDEKWLIRLTVAGFAFVISLMLFVIGLDVVRFTQMN